MLGWLKSLVPADVSCSADWSFRKTFPCILLLLLYSLFFTWQFYGIRNVIFVIFLVPLNECLLWFSKSAHAAFNTSFTSQENLNNDQTYNYQNLRIAYCCFKFEKNNIIKLLKTYHLYVRIYWGLSGNVWKLHWSFKQQPGVKLNLYTYPFRILLQKKQKPIRNNGKSYLWLTS